MHVKREMKKNHSSRIVTSVMLVKRKKEKSLKVISQLVFLRDPAMAFMPLQAGLMLSAIRLASPKV